MPVLRADTMSGKQGTRPDWCELTKYEIVSLTPGEPHVWETGEPANKVVVVEGSCRVGGGDGTERVVERGGTADLPAGRHEIGCDAAATVVTLEGHWGDDCGGAGLFAVTRSEDPSDIGDPVDYPKHTNFDRHYHDCDEYWIVVEGSGTAMSEETLYEVGPGDCLAIGMGHHHDFPLVKEPVRAVYFETTLEGQKRRGHLWEHTHGPAEPRLDRV